MILFMAVVVSAQTDTVQTGPLRWIGVYAGFAPQTESAALTLPGFAGCGQFTTGLARGWNAGAFFQMPLALAGDSNVRLHAGLGVMGVAGSFNTLPVLFPMAARDCTIIQGRVDQALDFRRTALTVQTGLSYPILITALRLCAGLQAEVPLSGYQTHKQIAVQPGDLLLGNNQRQLVIRSGQIFSPRPVTLNILAGVSYSFPIAAYSFIRPELILSVPLTGNLQGDNWRSYRLCAGVSVGFGIVHRDTIPGVRDTTHIVNPWPAPLLVPVILTLPDTAQVSVTEYDSTEALPLLNRIFFNQGSDTPGSEHKLLTASAAPAFTTSTLTGSAIEVYYDMLNIVGQRMSRNPAATLQLKGYCNSRERDAGLARRRANTVKQYFVNVWKIPARRITISGSAGIPPNATRELSEEGYAENARVEIIPSDPNITGPIIRRYLQRVATPPALTFRPEAVAQAGVAAWSLQVYQDTHLWKQFQGAGFLPDAIRWNWRGAAGGLPEYPMRLSYQLSVTDSTGRTVQTPAHDIQVAYTTLQQKLQNRQNDTVIQRFSLLLFNYDSPMLSHSDFLLLKAIASGTRPGATVCFTGYTDSLGGTQHNMALAGQRAAEAARQFRLLAPAGVNVTIGPDGGPHEQFPYNTPEGRSHCRTVAIEIRTPAEPDEHRGN